MTKTEKHHHDGRELRSNVLSFGLARKSELLCRQKHQNSFVPKLCHHGGKNRKKLGGLTYTGLSPLEKILLVMSPLQGSGVTG